MHDRGTLFRRRGMYCMCHRCGQWADWSCSTTRQWAAKCFHCQDHPLPQLSEWILPWQYFMQVFHYYSSSTFWMNSTKKLFMPVFHKQKQVSCFLFQNLLTIMLSVYLMKHVYFVCYHINLRQLDKMASSELPFPAKMKGHVRTIEGNCTVYSKISWCEEGNLALCHIFPDTGNFIFFC